MLENVIGVVYNADAFLFYFINISLQNPFFDLIMPLITNAGLYTIWIVICVIFAIFGGEKGRNVALILFIAIILGHFSSEILKNLFARPRPYEVLMGVHKLAYEFNSYSFPSGHATEVFIACIIIGKKYGYLIGFLLLAIVVTFSRVYIGVHYPSDVFAGALLGIGISILVLHFEDDILKLKNRFVHRYR
jgi:undecaprenyl-diphosphatase